MNLSKLKDERIKNFFTQHTLARKLGIGKSSYCRKEKGEVPFTLKDIKIIKKELGLTIEQIDDIFFQD